MKKLSNPVSIGDVQFDVLLNESTERSADVPQYPVENGYKVSDAILLSPYTISVTAIISNMPVTWRHRFKNARNRTKTEIDKLVRLYESRSLVTYNNRSKIYRNMAITSLSVPKAEDQRESVEVSISLQHVIVTSPKVVDIDASYMRSGTTGTNAGTAATTTAADATGQKEESKEKGSMLYGMTSAVKSMFSGGGDDE